MISIDVDMPELPEVETIVRGLGPAVSGWKIAGFATTWSKSLSVDERSFRSAILEAELTGVSRRGKHVIIRTDRALVIVIHLRMTGVLNTRPMPAAATGSGQFGKDFVRAFGRDARHVFVLTKDREKQALVFYDIRKFGTISLAGEREIEEALMRGRLGVEPLSADFTSKRLRELAHKHRSMNLHAFLLDQRIIAGIGNIYASEILFRAKLDYERKIGSLKSEESGRLYRSIRKVLKEAISYKGTTISDYRDAAGSPGGFQNKLAVYGRPGKSCRGKGCAGLIRKARSSQRSIFFCPECQN